MMEHDLQAILNQVYAWSSKQEFCGYNKHDGLNSPLLKLLLGWGKWPRIIAIQSIMRFPFNIRPLLGVKKSYNPKGLSLFCRGNLDLFECTKDEKYLQEAESLLEILEEISSPGSWSGKCWGYHYPWQDLQFFAPTNTPNAVVTSFVCESLLDAYKTTGNDKYLEIVASSIEFFLNDLAILKDTPEELCLAYMPFPMSMRVMDVSILIAAVIARHSYYSKNTIYNDTAKRLVNYVINQQTEYAAWYYTDPPGDSPICHDNYHTGFILDALDSYMQSTNDYSYMPQYKNGLDFYARNLFNENGSPKWMSNQDYPHDIHGAAQGILTFSRHLEDYPQLAYKIFRWTMDNLYNPKGRFYYQESKYFTKKFTLLRWCNAWMYRALTELHKNIKTSTTSSEGI